jgi:plastocyanin
MFNKSVHLHKTKNIKKLKMIKNSQKQKIWTQFLIISILTIVLLSSCEPENGSSSTGNKCNGDEIEFSGSLGSVPCYEVMGFDENYVCKGEEGYARCEEKKPEKIEEDITDLDDPELQSVDYTCITYDSDQPDSQTDDDEPKDDDTEQANTDDPEDLGLGGGGGGSTTIPPTIPPTTDPTTPTDPPDPPTDPTDPDVPETPKCYEGEIKKPCELIDEDDYIGKVFSIPEGDTINPLDTNFCDEYGEFPTEFGDYTFKFEIIETVQQVDNNCFAKVVADQDIDGVKPDLFISMYDIDKYLIDTDPIVGFSHVDPDDFEHTIQYGAKSFGYYYPDNKIDVQFVLDYIDEINKEVFIRLDESDYKTDENKIDFPSLDFDDVVINDKHIQGYWVLSNPCKDWEVNRAQLEKLYEKYRDESDKLRMIISFDDLTCLTELLDNKAERECNNICSTSSFYYDGEHCFEDEICSTPCLSYDCRPQPTKVITIDNFRFDEAEIEIFQGTTIAFENLDLHTHNIKHNSVSSLFEFDIAQYNADYYLFDEIGTYDVSSDEFVHMKLKVKVIKGTNYEISCYDECGIDSYSDGHLCFSDIDCEVLCKPPETCFELEPIKDIRFVDTAFIEINNSLSINEAKNKIDESCDFAQEFIDKGIEVIPIIIVDESVSVDWVEQISKYSNECEYFNGIIFGPWEDIIEKSVEDFNDAYYGAFSKEFS